MIYCEDNSNSYEIKPCRSCQNCPLCCYKALIKYSLFSNSYPTLMLAYQFLLTLPVTQIACERSFSTLKYIKNRLRSTMSNEHLENF
ncbi:Dimer Tnp hAT domain-containing protein, partial [Aphis craccivora]